MRRAVAYVDSDAIAANCRRLGAALAAQTALCAVVKADAYGHGAVASARAALAGGASWLAVATAEEAVELRAAGVDAPVLVMGALSDEELPQALRAGADVVVWRERMVEAVAAAGGGRVHVKLDSGMGRLGTRDASEALAVAARARQATGVVLAGAMTHLATADDRDDAGFFDRQLQAFAAFAGAVRELQSDVIVHAANSAAVLRDAASHFDMVRCGIAVYGMDPFGVDAAAHGLVPALELRSYVSEVKRCRAGESTGYGRRFVAQRDTWLGIVPLGYGDGFRRALSNNADVLVDGRRVAQVGTVSMDNIAVDLGVDESTQALVGSEAVIIGAQGGARITAEELARRIGTINYEITCGIGARVPRVTVSGDGERDGLSGGLAVGGTAAG